MINFALLGAGRIGKMHAKIINENPYANLKFVYDVNTESASKVAEENNAKITQTPLEAINNEEVDAILIASATPTHTEFLIMGTEANKSILCLIGSHFFFFFPFPFFPFFGLLLEMTALNFSYVSFDILSGMPT